MNNIMERVNKVFQTLFKDENLVITEETCAEDIEEWDSLQHISLLAMLEKEFDMEFEIDEIIAMEKVGDMIAIIEEKI